jgi:hypothetical protein
MDNSINDKKENNTTINPFKENLTNNLFNINNNYGNVNVLNTEPTKLNSCFKKYQNLKNLNTLNKEGDSNAELNEEENNFYKYNLTEINQAVYYNNNKEFSSRIFTKKNTALVLGDKNSKNLDRQNNNTKKIKMEKDIKSVILDDYDKVFNRKNNGSMKSNYLFNKINQDNFIEDNNSKTNKKTSCDSVVEDLNLESEENQFNYLRRTTINLIDSLNKLSKNNSDVKKSYVFLDENIFNWNDDNFNKLEESIFSNFLKSFYNERFYFSIINLIFPSFNLNNNHDSNIFNNYITSDKTNSKLNLNLNLIERLSDDKKLSYLSNQSNLNNLGIEDINNLKNQDNLMFINFSNSNNIMLNETISLLNLQQIISFLENLTELKLNHISPELIVLEKDFFTVKFLVELLLDLVVIMQELGDNEINNFVEEKLQKNENKINEKENTEINILDYHVDVYYSKNTNDLENSCLNNFKNEYKVESNLKECEDFEKFNISQNNICNTNSNTNTYTSDKFVKESKVNYNKNTNVKEIFNDDSKITTQPDLNCNYLFSFGNIAKKNSYDNTKNLNHINLNNNKVNTLENVNKYNNKKLKHITENNINNTKYQSKVDSAKTINNNLNNSIDKNYKNKIQVFFSGSLNKLSKILNSNRNSDYIEDENSNKIILKNNNDNTVVIDISKELDIFLKNTSIFNKFPNVDKQKLLNSVSNTLANIKLQQLKFLQQNNSNISKYDKNDGNNQKNSRKKILGESTFLSDDFLTKTKEQLINSILKYSKKLKEKEKAKKDLLNILTKDRFKFRNFATEVNEKETSSFKERLFSMENSKRSKSPLGKIKFDAEFVNNVYRKKFNYEKTRVLEECQIINEINGEKISNKKEILNNAINIYNLKTKELLKTNEKIIKNGRDINLISECDIKCKL